MEVVVGSECGTTCAKVCKISAFHGLHNVVSVNNFAVVIPRIE